MHLGAACSFMKLCRQSVFSVSVQSMRNSSTYTAHKIRHRGFVRVRGPDASAFLQGLLTNNLECVDTKCSITSLYNFLLNVQGRVLYDVILYNLQGDGYLMEVDKDIVSECAKTIKRYKLRKKVDISEATQDFDCFAIFAPQLEMQDRAIASLEPKRESKDVLVNCFDPRLKEMGRRLVTNPGTKVVDIFANVEVTDDPCSYHQHRYQLGVGEGLIDHPPGNSFPLECNAAFLNGVSFTKGCYIGQELTARTHHTGVIRKRLMPISLPSPPPNLPPDTAVKNDTGKSCGKIRGTNGTHGLALLRLENVLRGQELIAKSEDDEAIGIHVNIPHWWPIDSDEIIKQALNKVKPKVVG